MEQHEALPPALKESLMHTMKTNSPYWTLLGMELVDARKGWASVRLPFDRKLVHPLGIAHGGAIFSVADSAVAMALIGMVDREEIFMTVEMKLNYIMPFTDGSITAEARIIHRGTRTALGDVEVKNDRGDLVAKGLTTYMIIRKAP